MFRLIFFQKKVPVGDSDEIPEELLKTEGLQQLNPEQIEV